MTRTLTTAACLALAACGPPPTDDMPAATGSTGRVHVERIGVINDTIAYGNRRGIYVITDRKTGTEFIGVSGVGITETSAHTVHTGKTTYTTADER